LSHGLKIKSSLETLELKGLDEGHFILDKINSYHEYVAIPLGAEDYKPILRPLSDLTEEFVTNNQSTENQFDVYDIDRVLNQHRSQYKLYRLMYLFENHFDVFGLIEEGLAIDINSLN
jgi:hypothetical protein